MNVPYEVGQRVKVAESAAETLELHPDTEGTVMKVYHGEHAESYPHVHPFLAGHPLGVKWDDQSYEWVLYKNAVTGEQEYDWTALDEVEPAE